MDSSIQRGYFGFRIDLARSCRPTSYGRYVYPFLVTASLISGCEKLPENPNQVKEMGELFVD